MNPHTPEFSIIVPVYNCEQTITACLKSLQEQDHSAYEIIIVDDGSTDTTAEICAAEQDIQLVQVSNGGPSRARNIGITQAKGRFAAFTDGDCIVEKTWLTELRKGFSRNDVAGVGGNQISPPDDSPLARHIQETFTILGFATSYMKTVSSMSEISHNPSCNSAYRLSILRDLGGFDESLWPGEDVDLDQRLTRTGHVLIRNPAAVVQHHRPQSLTALKNMMQRYGSSACLLFKRYGFFRPLQYLPLVSALLLLCGLTGLIVNPPVTILLSSIACLAVLAFLFLPGHGFSRKTAVLFLLAVFIVVHWHIGFIKAFTGRA